MTAGILSMTMLMLNISEGNIVAKSYQEYSNTTKSEIKQRENDGETVLAENNDLGGMQDTFGILKITSPNQEIIELLKSIMCDYIKGNGKPGRNPNKKPKETEKPVVSVQPVGTVEPTVTVEPKVTVEPTAAVEPTVTVEPTATVESTITSDVPYDPMHIRVDTMEDLLAYNEKLDTGAIIETLGYFEKGDGGGAKYEIANKGNGKKFSTCTTAVGQHANLVVENEYINMKQLGAGACEQITYNTSDIVYNDDAARINEAIELVKDGKNGVIYFPEGEYRCASKIKVNGSNYTIKGDGNKSILYTDNGYRTADEHFFTIVSANNITLDGIRVEARETWKVAYYRQCSILYASDIQILNCEFSVKENVIAYDGNADKQYTNVTLYTGWHNITVDNCLLEQMGCVERGACIGIIDMWSEGCSNVSVTNCIMKQNGHDEMLGIFTKTGENAAIRDVYIANNQMYTCSAENVSNKTMAITIAYDDSKVIDNVVFKDNYVKAEIPSNLMTFGKISNCVIEDNEFDVVSTKGNTGVLFDTRTGVTVKNNNIRVRSENNAKLGQVFKRYGEFIENKVDCDCYVYSFMYQGGTARDNSILLKKGCHSIAIDPKEFSGNEVTVEENMNNIAHYENLGSDSLISDNVIHYLYDDSEVYSEENIGFKGYAVYAGFHANMNNFTVTFTKNTVHAPNVVKSNKGMLCYGLDDETPQKFIIKDNKVEAYKWIRNLYGQSLEGVTYEGNVDMKGRTYSIEDLLVMYFTSVK